MLLILFELIFSCMVPSQHRPSFKVFGDLCTKHLAMSLCLTIGYLVSDSV